MSKIAAGSKRDADMEISIKKTKVWQVQEQGRIPTATQAEAHALCKVKCPHIGCEKVFFNVHGMKCHAGRCRWKKEYEVDRVMDVRGEEGTAAREFLIRWKGYGPEDDTWEGRNNVHPEMINDYLKANNIYNYEWTGPR